ncbi:MAG: Rne/Rng family ribonuclease [Saprospiraceae bacterium]|nr:Rne/Rng family ribonuclease [Saprospiraceae bacterium]MBP7699000.1 Rne/Rng family ribonuclease [Saprospiraceae bacterium]
MEKELIINTSTNEVEIALLESGKLVELHHQQTGFSFAVGDVFVGRITKLMPGLNAAFVNIGHAKDAFLHYTDLGPKVRSLLKFTEGAISGSITTPRLDNFKLEREIVKTGKIDQALQKKNAILVQILKEPISTKGPRLTCELTLPGRYMVLTPFSEGVSVSKKIESNEERLRLQKLGESIKPKNFGLIIRTAAEGKKIAELHEEMNLMVKKWEDIFAQLKGNTQPIKLMSELDKASSILRDVLNESFNKIVVNDKELYENTRTYLKSIAPEKLNIVSLHKSKRSIFEEYGISRQIKSSFGKTATLSSGAYIVIEHTEAMHVIDVNSGHKVTSTNQDNAVLTINMEAAEEVARQLRLRDIGGIIIVDFIDMKNVEHRKLLQSSMQNFMKSDKAQHTILPLSKFGLMQITRERVRPEVKINTSEVCPTCKGSGKVNPTILLTDDIERDLEFIVHSRPKSKLSLHVHPFVQAYLKKGWKNTPLIWYLRHHKWVRILPDSNLGLTEYHFYDENNDEIRLNNHNV